MAAQGNQPVSAANLAAALGSGSGSVLTGSEPVSVDNLRAVLAALGVDILYDGPKASGTVQLLKSMEGYDYIAIETLTSGERDYYGMVCATPYSIAVGYPQKYSGNCFTTTTGEVCASSRNPALTATTNFPASGSYEAVHLSDNDRAFAVLRVFGMRLKDGPLAQSSADANAVVSAVGGVS